MRSELDYFVAHNREREREGGGTQAPTHTRYVHAPSAKLRRLPRWRCLIAFCMGMGMSTGKQANRRQNQVEVISLRVTIATSNQHYAKR